MTRATSTCRTRRIYPVDRRRSVSSSPRVGLLFDDPTITIGLLHLPILCVVGIIILLAGIYGWAFEPAADPEPVPARVEPTSATVSH